MAEVTMEIPLRGVLTDARSVSALVEWIQAENASAPGTSGNWEINDKLLRYPWSRRIDLRSKLQSLIDSQSQGSHPENSTAIEDLKRLLSKIDEQGMPIRFG